MRSWLLATGGVLLMLAMAVAADPDPSDDEVRERARTLLADPSFQTELPGMAGEGRFTARDNPAQGDIGREERRNPGTASEGQAPPLRRRHREPEPSPAVSGAASAFLWVVIAVILIFGLIATVREARRGRRQRVVAYGDETATEDAARHAVSHPDEIEALANSGRFTEAVHLLLQRALGHLSQRQHLDRSLTSREILRRPEIGAGREPLSTLVETVERSWFGGVPVDRDAYRACLAASRRLTTSRRLAT